MNLRRAARAAGVVVVVSAFTACGGSSNSSVEKAIEQQTGANVDGDTGSLDATSGDGSVNISSTSKIPDSWPAEVPTPDGLAITSAFEVSATGSGGITLMGTTSSSTFVADYAAALDSAGFTSASAVGGATATHSVYQSDAWNVGIIMLPQGTDSQVTITLYPAG
jgi:hypothetical protein